MDENSNYNENNNNQQYPYQPMQELEEPVTMGEWLITMLIMLIPCVNIIMVFVWAFSRKEKKSKSNYFKAYLIYMAVAVVLYLLLVLMLGISLYTISGSYYYWLARQKAACCGSGTAPFFNKKG